MINSQYRIFITCKNNNTTTLSLNFAPKKKKENKSCKQLLRFLAKNTVKRPSAIK